MDSRGLTNHPSQRFKWLVLSPKESAVKDVGMSFISVKLSAFARYVVRMATHPLMADFVDLVG
jgi:hypothetical protein